MKNIFYETTGADWFLKPYIIAFATVFGALVAYMVVKAGLVTGLGLVALPLGITFLYAVFNFPKVGIYAIMLMGFSANGLSRYLDGIPWGLALDSLLVLTLVAIIFHKTKNKDWHKAQNGLMLAGLIWFAYNFLELFNPEARSFEAWFYAMRGVALYPLLLTLAALVLMDDKKELETFITIWFVLSNIAVLNGMRQQHIGLDGVEQAWLDAGAHKVHILFGKLRVFSFYSDAGQFGAAQAHTFVSASIMALDKTLSPQRKVFFILTALFNFYGMMISGTRGALAIPTLGFLTYFFLSKNFKILVLGLTIGFTVFGLLKFTYIGQNIYAINRMRTALDPEDPSLLVRLENQKKLADYLANRPFGGGVGSAGYWGLKFSPGTFLAETPTDSWYVRIWAEEGIIGLTLHLIILFYIAIQGGYWIWIMKDEALRQKMMALHAGVMGIYLASYGNGVLGQIPTGVIMYMSWAYLFMIPTLEKQKDTDQK